MRLLRDREKAERTRWPRRTEYRSPWSAVLPYTIVLVIVLAMAYGLRQEAIRLGRQEGPVHAGLTPRTTPIAGQNDELEKGGHGTEEVVIDLEVLERYTDHDTSIAEEPFRYLVNLCAPLMSDKLQRLARTDFTYRDLYERSHEFRGQVLKFRGRVRRVREVPAGTGYKVDRYYECWVFTADAGRLPYCVISVRPPEGIPVAERLNLPCEVIGIYLGWWKHETGDRRLLSSPIVVTPQLRRIEIPSATLDRPGVWIGIALGLLILGGLLVVLWLSGRGSPMSGSEAEPPQLVTEEGERSGDSA